MTETPSYQTALDQPLIFSDADLARLNALGRVVITDEKRASDSFMNTHLPEAAWLAVGPSRTWVHPCPSHSRQHAAAGTRRVFGARPAPCHRTGGLAARVQRVMIPGAEISNARHKPPKSQDL